MAIDLWLFAAGLGLWPSLLSSPLALASGLWPLASGLWPLTFGRSLTFGFCRWPWPSGLWHVASGLWPLASGCSIWPLASGSLGLSLSGFGLGPLAFGPRWQPMPARLAPNGASYCFASGPRAKPSPSEMAPGGRSLLPHQWPPSKGMPLLHKWLQISGPWPLTFGFSPLALASVLWPLASLRRWRLGSSGLGPLASGLWPLASHFSPLLDLWPLLVALALWPLARGLWLLASGLWPLARLACRFCWWPWAFGLWPQIGTLPSQLASARASHCFACGSKGKPSPSKMALDGRVYCFIRGPRFGMLLPHTWHEIGSYCFTRDSSWGRLSASQVDRWITKPSKAVYCFTGVPDKAGYCFAGGPR